MAVRVMGLTQGPVADPLAASGLNATVFSALARQANLVEILDVSLQGMQRYWNALRNWHPDRHQWMERYDLNVWSFQTLSRLAGSMLAEREGTFDVVFQLRTMYTPGVPPGRWPYTMILDNTYALSDRMYRPWAPMRGKERQRWLDLEREAYHCASAVFARTHWVRRSLIEDYGLPPEKAVWVGSGCHFRLDSLPVKKQPDDGRTILFVGKEWQRKGVPVLLEAFKQVRQSVPDARLLLVGKDTVIDQPGVEVLGKIKDRARLQKIYEQSTIFVLPALFEPAGNVLPEAMSYRLPCIVTTAGGLADFVEEGKSGYIVEPNRPTVLAERVVQLLTNQALRKQMGETAYRRVVDTFHWDRVMDHIVPHLEQAAGISRQAN